jgi:NADH-quinone oxidoreductase subunit D
VHTGFLCVSIQEKIYEIYEEICGARLTTNMGRIGGLNAIGHPKPLLLETFFRRIFHCMERI